MPSRSLAVLGACVALFLSAPGPAARAASYSSLIVYGDSLSDNGNLYNAIGYPGAPYYQGRFSNGPVAVEQLASLLGIPLHDFAYGGATTGYGNYIDGGTQTSPGTPLAPGLPPLPGMFTELAASAGLLASPLTSSSLFVVWGGANDYFAGGTAATAVADIDAIVTTLINDGAKTILVPNLPNLALTPEYAGQASAMNFALQFNAGLLATLPAGATYVDTYGLLNSIYSDPSAYGFSNVTGDCFNGVTLCSNAGQYLFFDHVHPTTQADAYLAKDFLSYVQPIPEPSSLLLLATGLGTLAAGARARLAARKPN